MMATTKPRFTQITTDVEIVSRAIMSGKIVCYPTDTSFGLGGDATNQQVVNKIIEIKQRINASPFPILVSDLSMFAEFGEITETVHKLIDRFLPGKLTIVVKSISKMPAGVLSNDNMIGIRIPNYPATIEMIKLSAKPVVGTSCNASKMKPMYNAKLIAISPLSKMIDCILDGQCEEKVEPSTVVKIIEDKVILIREGAIKYTEIIDYLKVCHN